MQTPLGQLAERVEGPHKATSLHKHINIKATSLHKYMLTVYIQHGGLDSQATPRHATGIPTLPFPPLFHRADAWLTAKHVLAD